MLGQRGQVGVVVDEYRHLEPLGHQVAEGHVVQRQIHGNDAGTATLIHQTRNSETDGGDLPAHRFARLHDRVHGGVEKRGLVETCH